MQTKKTTTSSKSLALIEKIVNKMTDLHLPRKNFICSILLLYLSLRGRYTFKGMSRYGSMSEKNYRLHFEKPFDYLAFNVSLCLEHTSSKRILAFDPSYLPKSGKATPHCGKFWSGCLGKAVRGLEIGGLGVVDLDHNTAFNLESIQTPTAQELDKEGKSLVDHYAKVITDRGAQLSKLAKYLVVDGYFAKQDFIEPILKQTDLEVVCKLRKDANLQYLYTGPKKKGRGRPKKYAGKVNLNDIDLTHFKKVFQDQDVIIYEAILWSVFLKRKIKVAYVLFLKEGKATKKYAVFFSTDLDLDALTIYQYYKARFQIEFLFRDAKQFTGLTHCQARSENKIYFHVNTSLTAVGVAKIAHYFDSPKENKTTYSIADIKTIYFNQLMINLFFSNFQINTEVEENKQTIDKILKLGMIAA